MIVSSRNRPAEGETDPLKLVGRASIILQQLGDLRLYAPTGDIGSKCLNGLVAIYFTEHYYDPNAGKRNPAANALCPGEKSREYVLVTVRFPNDMLDKKAEKEKIRANLCNLFTHDYVKGVFTERTRDSFMMFDADDR